MSPTPTLEQHLMWDDIAILLRYLLMLSFNNSLDGQNIKLFISSSSSSSHHFSSFLIQCDAGNHLCFRISFPSLLDNTEEFNGIRELIVGYSLLLAGLTVHRS